LSDAVNDYVSVVVVSRPLCVTIILDACIDVHIDKCDICVDSGGHWYTICRATVFLIFLRHKKKAVYKLYKVYN